MGSKRMWMVCGAGLAATALAGCGAAGAGGATPVAALAAPPSSTAPVAAPSSAAPTAAARLAASHSSVVYEWAQFGGGLPGRTDVGISPQSPFGVGPIHRSAQVVPGISGQVVQVASSNSNDYALTRGGAVYAWGAGAQGELGNGTRVPLAETPVRVKFPAGVRIVSLPNPMPYNGGMAIAANGRVWAWGNDRSHEFCRRGGPILTTPVELRLHHVTLAVGALRHALYDAGGRIVSCGAGQNGQLGNGTGGAAGNSWKPVAVKGLPAGRAVTLTSAWGNAGVLMANGSYYDWGYNADGQVGNGTTRRATTAFRVPLPGRVKQVFEGGSFGKNGQTIALLRNGSLWEWGAGTFGQLGTGRRADALRPVRLHASGLGRVVSVNSGGATNYAINRRGQLWAWGDNSVGEVGSGSPRQSQPRPVLDPITVRQVAGTAHNVVALGSTGG